MTKIYNVSTQNKQKVIDWFSTNDFELHKDFEFEFELQSIFYGHYKLTFKNAEAEMWYLLTDYEKSNN